VVVDDVRVRLAEYRVVLVEIGDEIESE